MTLREPLRSQVARIVHDGRVAIGWTKTTLGQRAGLSREMVGHVEAGRVNATVDVVSRLMDALGQEPELTVRRPFVARSRQADAGHATCGGFVQRRLTGDGWEVRREVEVIHGRSHGWIDVLAFHPPTATLLVVEIKTEIHDLGRIERTLAWYRREAWTAARRFGWRPRRVSAWLLVLATGANDDRISANREAIAQSFEGAGMSMLEPGGPDTGIALINPHSHRREWLMRARAQGRRSAAPYADYAAFVAARTGGGSWRPPGRPPKGTVIPPRRR